MTDAENRAFREANIDKFQPMFRRQGFCAARSPESRMCTRPIGHAETQHHAEDGQRVVVETWAVEEVAA